MLTMYVSYLLLLSTAEIQQGVPIFDRKRMQNDLMHLAFTDELFREALLHAQTPTDECTWRGVECAGSCVTAVFAAKTFETASRLFSVSTEWLPPTVEFVHFRYISIPHIWERMCLPRMLRYLYLENCTAKHWKGMLSNKIDFARLPRRMEELILIHTDMGGMIQIDGLPETMQFVYIMQHERFVESIGVHYEDIPNALRELHVTNGFDAVIFDEMVRAVGKPNEVKLQTKYDNLYPEKGSAYVAEFAAKLL